MMSVKVTLVMVRGTELVLFVDAAVVEDVLKGIVLGVGVRSLKWRRVGLIGVAIVVKAV